MLTVEAMLPAIRVAHYYQFPADRNAKEVQRRGYCYALHLVHGGRGKVTVDGTVYPVTKGDLIYLQPGVVHSFYSRPEDPLSTYNIYCDLWKAPQPTSIHLEWDENPMKQEYLTHIVTGTQLDQLEHYYPLQHEGEMTMLLAHIVHKHHQQGEKTNAITSSLLYGFLLELLQIVQERRVGDYRIREIMYRMDREAASGCPYESWQAASGLGKTQFYYLFKQAAGMSPKAYWTRALMKQASIYLAESDSSITDLAEHLGYSSIHSFTKQFTAFYGISPQRYRKQKRGLE
ncbi:AraC family transcriptional regulator [Paenibacillus sp. GCM10023252]|uniref:AraC family transcriptional regulator n=1 Tax=Paenibacillus sp. GCM10023252 TaxID=3252649 RepID=UPI0036077512